MENKKRVNSMLDRQVYLKTIKWSLAFCLGLQVVFIILLFGRQPLLLRRLIYPSAQPGRQGMRLAVYNNSNRSGAGQVQGSPGALARLENPDTSLEAYGVWEIKNGGTQTLIFHCDDYGAVFIDGHQVISLQGISADNQGHAIVPLDAGPHLLVVYLFNGPNKGFFRLEVLGPGQETPTPLPPQQLHPVNLDHSWEGIYWGLTWIRTGWFWVAFTWLLLLTLSFYGAGSLRQGVFNGVLFFGGCLLAGILGEGTARLFFEPPPTVFFKEQSDSIPKQQKGEKLFIMDTDRGRRNRPNSEVVIKNHPYAPQGLLTYKSNSIGYRNPEIGPKNGRRVLFLGDSITFGIGIPEENIFVRLVENLARQQGESWETINSAVGGSGMNAELAILTETGLSLQPDLVVLDFYLNDFQESPGIYLTTLPGILNRSRLAHKLVKVYRANLLLSQSGDFSTNRPMNNTPEGFPAWQEAFKKHSTVIPENQQPDQATLAFNEAVITNFTDWGGTFIPQVWIKMEALLEEMARLAKQHKFQLAIIAFPVSFQVEAAQLYDYPQQRLSRIARKLKAPYLDLLPLFRRDYEKNKKGGERLFYDNCHLTIRGHQVTAQAVYQFLKQAPSRNE
jgi:lysophospholipase L1-like esterase